MTRCHIKEMGYRRDHLTEYENIILTSHQNAIDKQMAQKFGKKIENIGVDYDGMGESRMTKGKEKEEENFLLFY